jgi:hypothetical protein
VWIPDEEQQEIERLWGKGDGLVANARSEVGTFYQPPMSITLEQN